MHQLTREEFQDALKKGLGRAVQHVRSSPPEAVRDDLVHACTEYLAWSSQQDGCRVTWLFRMIEATGEYDYYRQKIIEAVEQIPDDTYGIDTICQLFGLMAKFAERGDNEVLEIMRRRFDSARILYVPHFGFDELFRLDGIDALIRFLRREWKRVCDDEELWADDDEITIAEEELGKEVVQAALKVAARDDESIRFCLERIKRQQAEQEARKAAEEKQKQKLMERPEVLPNLRELIDGMENDGSTKTKWKFVAFRNAFLSRHNSGDFYAKPTPEELEYAFQKLLEATDPEHQLCLLGIFIEETMPRFDSRLWPLLFNAPNSEVRWAAEQAFSRMTDPAIREKGLKLIRKKPDSLDWIRGIDLLEKNFMTDPVVRERGLELIAKGPEFKDWHCGIDLLEKSFQAEDEFVIMKKLESVPPDTYIDDMHNIGYSVIKLARANPEVRLESLLLWVYEHTFCADCRCRSVEQMIKRNIAPQHLLEECLDDSYKDTRELVAK